MIDDCTHQELEKVSHIKVPSRIDADPIVSFTTTLGVFVTDSYGLKVRTSLLSTATRRPKRVKDEFAFIVT
jgi:hypothetical protein